MNSNNLQKVLISKIIEIEQILCREEDVSPIHVIWRRYVGNDLFLEENPDKNLNRIKTALKIVAKMNKKSKQRVKEYVSPDDGVEAMLEMVRRIYRIDKEGKDLSKKKCISCEGNIRAFHRAEIQNYLKDLNGWHVFKVKNFVQAEKFIVKVGRLAEREGHHPDISFGWGYARIRSSTHAIKGLAESDFILAAKIDEM
jgi:4a-hydroxytetrahydrobiopterin dehydratase